MTSGTRSYSFDKDYHPYESSPRQFRNTPLVEPPMMLMNGGTIVDIDFVDFDIALDSIDTIEQGGDPITVLGCKREPFCVAKSMVMMLCQ